MKAKDFIEQAGGSMSVANQLRVNQASVLKWSWLNRIPIKFWDFFIRKTDASLEDLYQLAVKQKKR